MLGFTENGRAFRNLFIDLLVHTLVVRAMLGSQIASNSTYGG
jgi:hypothetical protein